MPYEQDEQDSATIKWIILFVVLSLLAHVVLLFCIIFLSKHIPAPKLESPEQAPTTTITLVQPPQAPPAPKPIFMTTAEQKNAPHKLTQVQSDKDSQLASLSKTTRKDSIMPDNVSQDQHSSSLQSSPSSPQVKAQDQNTPPTPAKDQAKPQPQQPPQPEQPPQPKAEKPTPPNPTKTPPPPNPAPTPPKTPPPQFDANGLPVLPQIAAPTVAPQNSATQAQRQQRASVAPAMPIVPMNMKGLAGISGQPSPEAMKTPLGLYKAQFYAAVGSQWYSRLTPDKIQLIGVGNVRVHYTIYKDGAIKTWVVSSEASNSSSPILLPLSEESIRAVSPFHPFSEAMIKEVGDSYSDDFTFSIYSN